LAGTNCKINAVRAPSTRTQFFVGFQVIEFENCNRQKIFKVHNFDCAICVADQLCVFWFYESFDKYNFATAFLIELLQLVNHFPTKQLNLPPVVARRAHEEMGVLYAELAQHRTINRSIDSAHYFNGLLFVKIDIVHQTVACSNDAFVKT